MCDLNQPYSNEMFRWNRKGNLPVMKENGIEVPYLTVPALHETGIVLHGFSTRMGGVSEGMFAALNLSFTRGDKEEAVRENYRRIAAEIGFEPENMVFSQQTHTTNIRTVTKEDRGNGFTRPLPYTDVDGLVTNVLGLTLTTFYADCVPLFFVDPVKKAIGLSHSGWRGTAAKMGKKTVERMQEEYGCQPSDILSAIGPSICRNCYEVSGDVIEELKQSYTKEQLSCCYDTKEEGKYQLDLWELNQCVLLEAGIRPEHITVTDLCTCCNDSLLYSHRASQGRRGNLAAFLMLK